MQLQVASSTLGITEDDVIAMANSNTVAVLLPGAFFTLKETQKPPIELLRQYKVPMAIATDAAVDFFGTQDEVTTTPAAVAVSKSVCE